MKRLLLVDDEDIVTTTLAPVLRARLHVEVHTARDGNEAMELLRRAAFDVVIADYNMQGINGLELLRRLREEHPQTLRVLVTGQAPHGFRDQVDRDGTLHGYIQKPYSLRRVQKMLRDLLDHPPRPDAGNRF